MTRALFRVCAVLALSTLLLLPTAARGGGAAQWPSTALVQDTCTVTAGDVLINEVLPAPQTGPEWVELYNTTGSAVDIGHCVIDDIDGGSSPYHIPAGTTVPAGGFWTLDRTNYFNNGGDDVRFLEDDVATVLDAYSYGTTDYDVSWYRLPDGGTWQAIPTASPTKGASNGDVGECGTGTWVAGNLEIHHINIGQGDATLIVGPDGKSLLFDAGESYWNSSVDAQKVGPYVEQVLGCRVLDYVVISHFHVDHIGYVGYGGLYHLVELQGFTVGQMLHRDYDAYLGDTSATFENWRTYLEGDGLAKLNPTVAVEGTAQVDLGTGVTFDIVVVDGNGALKAGDFSADASPPSENDYSLGAVIRYGAFDEWIGGDLDGEFSADYDYTYHDIELSAAAEVGDVDVYRVNHHGSDHSSNATFVAQLDPEVSVVTVGDANTYDHPRQTVMDRLLATSDVYMTERGDLDTDIGDAVVAGDIVITTSDGISYTVNGTGYTATDPVRTDADEDGYFAGVDPDDDDAAVGPAPNGGCDLVYQYCADALEVFLPLVMRKGSAPDVQITDIEYDPPGSDLEGEYVRIENGGGAAQVMTGWTLSDAAEHTFTFPAFTLPAGGTVRVWTKAGTDTATDLYWGRGQAVWTNTGDCSYLRDTGATLRSTYCYAGD